MRDRGHCRAVRSGHHGEYQRPDAACLCQAGRRPVLRHGKGGRGRCGPADEGNGCGHDELGRPLYARPLRSRLRHPGGHRGAERRRSRPLHHAHRQPGAERAHCQAHPGAVRHPAGPPEKHHHQSRLRCGIDVCHGPLDQPRGRGDDPRPQLRQQFPESGAAGRRYRPGSHLRGGRLAHPH